MHIRQLAGEALVEGIASALSGGAVVAPLGEARLERAIRPEEAVTEPDAALVIPTSGTTGDPKAVVLSAGAVRSSVLATHERLGGPGDWVCALPTQHVAGLMVLARAVVAGTKVTFARTDLTDLPRPMGRAYLSLVAAQLDQALTDPAKVASLAGYAAVLVGGSAIRPELVASARNAGIALVTTYGASETCGGCVYDGLPLRGVRVELSGERIILGGPMVFSGYRLRPELTASTLRGDQVLTNDRGRLDGERLTVLGRLDDLVISGGEKVDLAHAQRVCEEEFGSPAEGGLVLLALPDERWGHRVVAVSTAAWTLSQVRRRLAPRIGQAATPKELRQLPALAYTSIGKIDRSALILAWETEG